MKSVLVILLFAVLIPARADDSTMPTLPVESLAARQLTVPEDLRNLPHLFIVGFSKASGFQATQWSRLVEGRFLPSSLAIYNVSVIEDVPRLLRGLIVSSIRSGVPEQLHDRFLVASRQARDWKSLASYSEPDAAYLVLTNSNHQVVWRARGPATEAKVQALVEQVSALSQQAQQSVPASAVEQLPAS